MPSIRRLKRSHPPGRMTPRPAERGQVTHRRIRLLDYLGLLDRLRLLDRLEVLELLGRPAILG